MKNNETGPVQQEAEEIRKFLRLDNNQTEVPLKQVIQKQICEFRYFFFLFKCISYLWSDANSAFDPLARSNITKKNMNEPLNHYWISSSHNT